MTCSGKPMIYPGRGIEARIPDEEIIVGSPELMNHHGISIPVDVDRSGAGSGEIEVIVAKGRRVNGFIRIEDALMSESPEVIRNIHEFGIEKTGMITDDSSGTATTIASRSGLVPELVWSHVDPQQKQNIIADLQKRGEKICFIGAGTNDGPALAQADIGVSIESRSDTIALRTSHVVLMQPGLHQLMSCLNWERRQAG